MAFWVVVPPAPVQLIVYVVVALRAPVAFVPLAVREPVQPPDAVQDVALVEAQVNVELPPRATLLGPALKETLGGAAETVTVADCEAEPTAPVHVSMYVVVVVSAAVDVDPPVDSLPLQPPEAVQLVALVDVQASVEKAPLLTVLGLADRATAGAAFITETVADWVALPPAPVQVSP
jgi:hypothetical protein